MGRRKEAHVAARSAPGMACGFGSLSLLAESDRPDKQGDVAPGARRDVDGLNESYKIKGIG